MMELLMFRISVVSLTVAGAMKETKCGLNATAISFRPLQTCNSAKIGEARRNCNQRVLLYAVWEVLRGGFSVLRPRILLSKERLPFARNGVYGEAK